MTPNSKPRRCNRREMTQLEKLRETSLVVSWSVWRRGGLKRIGVLVTQENI